MSNLPPLPKNFSQAVDLSSLGKPKVELPVDSGLVITQKNLVSEILPASSQKVVIIICWSPRSQESIELVTTMAEFSDLDKDATGENTWLLATVNVDEEAQVAQALQVQSIPLAIAVIQEQPVPLFESVPPKEQIKMVLEKVLSLAAERGIGNTSTPNEPMEVPMEPEEIEAMTAMESGDFKGAKAAYVKLLNRKPADNLAKLGLAQTELLIRIEGLDPAAVISKADTDPSNLTFAIEASDVEIANGNNKAAFDRLIAAIKLSTGDERKKVQEHLIILFLLVDPADPDLIIARKQLASALF